jgi:tRNA threonylcarbamoyladenosine biosynthesis protein TsaE
MRIISNSEKDTQKIASRLARKFRGGETVALYGTLGSGKTVFSKGIAEGLGVKKNINSPTFVIMKVYNIAQNKCIKKLCHIDAYRLISGEELHGLGVEEQIGENETVTVIEWAEKAENLLPPCNLIKISFKSLNEHEREINIIARRCHFLNNGR